MTNNAPMFICSNESITVIADGAPLTLLAGTAQFAEASRAIAAKDWEGLRQSLTFVGALSRWLGPDFSVDGTTLKHKGRPLPAALNDRINAMITGGESPEPLLKFFERLSRNPSMRSVEQLYSFLAHSNIPLETDGTFLAYKGIRKDLKDQHSGTVDNSPGQVHEMDRNLVSDDPMTPCHYGFHVGALEYASSFAPVTVICRVDPEHVVCVPHDYSAQKMRVHKYEVVGFYNGIPMSSTVEDDGYEDDLYEEEEDEEDDLYDDYEDDLDVSTVAIPAPHRCDTEQTTFAFPDGFAFASPPVPVQPEPEKKATLPRGIGTMDAAKLMGCSIEDLRRYAGSKLKIVGASKIPGGKSALVSKILKIRKKVTK
jgi:hypothetical protein